MLSCLRLATLVWRYQQGSLFSPALDASQDIERKSVEVDDPVVLHSNIVPQRNRGRRQQAVEVNHKEGRE